MAKFFLALDEALYRIHRKIDADADAAIHEIHQAASSYRRRMGQLFRVRP